MQKTLNQSRLQILSAPAQFSTVQWFYICYEMKNYYSVASPAELSKLQVDWGIWQGSYKVICFANGHCQTFFAS